MRKTFKIVEILIKGGFDPDDQIDGRDRAKVFWKKWEDGPPRKVLEQAGYKSK